ncbi:MAG: hypothetical protein ACJ796_02400 [Gemmatimonadaceae bacterium]
MRLHLLFLVPAFLACNGESRARPASDSSKASVRANPATAAPDSAEAVAILDSLKSIRPTTGVYKTANTPRFRAERVMWFGRDGIERFVQLLGRLAAAREVRDTQARAGAIVRLCYDFRAWSNNRALSCRGSRQGHESDERRDKTRSQRYPELLGTGGLGS